MESFLGRSFETPALVFLEALIPRLLLAVLFWSTGFLGPGGDPQAYHVLGRYLAQTWEDPLHADLLKVEAEAGMEPLEPMYAMHRDNVERFSNPDSVWQYLNTVMPVVFLHGVMYWLWDDPLGFLVLNALLSAWAVGRAVRDFGLGAGGRRWLVWNPVSLFFSATHFKESITESLVLGFAGSLYARREVWRALGWCAAVAMFRLSYAAVLVALVVVDFLGVGGWRTSRVVWLLVGILLVLPDIHAPDAEASGGGVFGRLVGTEWGRKLAAPLLGLLLPLPFQGLFRGAGIGAWEVFTAVYGCTYHWAGWRIWVGWTEVQKTQTARRLVNGVLSASLLIGYLFLGGPGVKDRYFAPFVAVLILAVGVAEPKIRRG